MSRPRKAMALLAVIAATGLIGSVSLRADPKQPNRISMHAFMRAKLASSQRVMEGLVTKELIPAEWNESSQGRNPQSETIRR